jgi:hypothetical protein
MPPRRYNEFLQRSRGTKTETTGTTRTRRTAAPRTSTPQDMEMSARASRVGRGRQTAPAAGRQGLGGSAMYSIQDMLKHPAVDWSRNMAQGPAQGKVDSITNDVMAKLAEPGLNRGPDGTWSIDFAANTAYRNNKNGASQNPVYTAATPSIPSSGSAGGFPGPAKPPAPTGGTLPRQTSGGLPPGTLPRQPTTGGLPAGTLPRQGSVYEPGKPPAPSLPVIPSPQLTSKPAATGPGANGVTPSPGLGGGFPSTVTPVIGQRGPATKPPQPAPPMYQEPTKPPASTSGYITPGAGPVNATPTTAPPPQSGGVLPPSQNDGGWSRIPADQRTAPSTAPAPPGMAEALGIFKMNDRHGLNPATDMRGGNPGYGNPLPPGQATSPAAPSGQPVPQPAPRGGNPGFGTPSG